MGSGIATALILSNYPVILKEVNEKFLKSGIDRVKGTCVLIYGTLLGIEGPFQKFCFRNFKCLYCCNFSANLQSRVNKGKMSQEKCERTLSLLTGVLDYQLFKDVDMVIEARQSTTLFFFPLFYLFVISFFFCLI